MSFFDDIYDDDGDHGFVEKLLEKGLCQPENHQGRSHSQRQLKDAVCFIWLHFMSKQGGNSHD